MLRDVAVRAPGIVCALALTILGLSGCLAQKERIDPAVARYSILALLPPGVEDAAGWAEDIRAAFHTLEIDPTAQNICAVIAVTQQESTFEAQPVVPGLPQIARREIDQRAARYHIPKFLVNSALAAKSADGRTYAERISAVRTEKELSDVFDDFIGRVPMGQQLFSGWNPVRTGGPMQVSIAFAEQHAAERPYPYARSPDVRDEVFTRRGGLYFGIAHLLDYPVSYDRMLYRFADFNAGRYASRNAAFQSAVGRVAKSSLALDGDLVLYDADPERIGETEAALHKIAGRISMSESQIRADLELGRRLEFEESTLYRRVFETAEAAQGRSMPRAVTPEIPLQSAKITRKLTTRWFAERVDQRYRACLGRGSA